MQDKLQPQAIELEQSVLGAILLESESLQTVTEILTPESFYDPKHFLIFSAIIDLINTNSPVDLLTVANSLKKKNQLESAGGAYYISTLGNRVASSANVEYHSRIIQQKKIQRDLIKLGFDIERAAYEDLDVFTQIDYVEQKITELTTSVNQHTFKTSLELFKEALVQNDRILSLNGKLVGITSGFRAIDEITGGWQEPDLIIIGAAPGMGKTALALEFAKRPAIQGITTAIFSLEMNNRQLYSRMLSQESGIDINRINRTGLNKSELEHLKLCTEKLRNAPIYFDDSNMNIMQLKSKARKLKRKYDIKLLVIDFLQKITAPNVKGNRKDEVTHISQSLKSLAKELKIPIICLSSLNTKDIEKQPGKVPVKANLRDSGDIESDADVIILLYRPEYYGIDTDEAGNSTAEKCMCMVDKNRNGAVDTAIIGFRASQTKFYSIGVEEPTMNANTDFLTNNK